MKSGLLYKNYRFKYKKTASAMLQKLVFARKIGLCYIMRQVQQKVLRKVAYPRECGL